MYIFTLFSLFLQYHYHRTSKIDIIENWYVYISYLYIHFIFNIKYINIIIPYELRNLYLYTCIYVYISYLYISLYFQYISSIPQYHYHMNSEIDTIVYMYIFHIYIFILFSIYFLITIIIWTPKLNQLYICIYLYIYIIYVNKYIYSLYFQYISSIPLPHELRNWYNCIYIYLYI